MLCNIKSENIIYCFRFLLICLVHKDQAVSITEESLSRFVYKLTRNPMNGVCQRNELPVMKSMKANDNRRVKQTMLRNFKRAAIFRDKHYPNIEASVTLFAFVILTSQFLENNALYGNAFPHVISFK